MWNSIEVFVTKICKLVYTLGSHIVFKGYKVPKTLVRKRVVFRESSSITPDSVKSCTSPSLFFNFLVYFIFWLVPFCQCALLCDTVRVPGPFKGRSTHTALTSVASWKTSGAGLITNPRGPWLLTSSAAGLIFKVCNLEITFDCLVFFLPITQIF